MKKITALFMILVLAVAMLTGAFAENDQAAAPAAAPTVIALGEKVQLMVAEAQAENAETVWTVSDETIVTVDVNGMATALNAGSATVTAAVTTTTIETIENTVYEIVREAKENGELFTRRVEKIVTEEVEKVENAAIEIAVVVESALCPGCNAEYTNAAEFAAHVQNPVCGVETHYECDAIEDHETQLDPFCDKENPHRNCEAGVATHDCASCGNTYACEDSGSHTECLACGNAWCFKDNGNHTTPACGKIEHRACVQEDYNKNDHYRCSLCHQRKCNGYRHGEGKCVK